MGSVNSNRNVSLNFPVCIVSIFSISYTDFAEFWTIREGAMLWEELRETPVTSAAVEEWCCDLQSCPGSRAEGEARGKSQAGLICGTCNNPWIAWKVEHDKRQPFLAIQFEYILTKKGIWKWKEGESKYFTTLCSWIPIQECVCVCVCVCIKSSPHQQAIHQQGVWKFN